MKEYIKNTKKGFNIKEVKGVTLLTIPDFEKAGFIKHCFTSRKGGVSEGCYESLNLSITREENEANKKTNFSNVCNALDVKYGSIVLVNYSHADGIYIATNNDTGKGFLKENDLPFCDSIIVDEKDITGVTLHADCMSVFFADKAKKIVAAAHAGYKGVFLDLPQKVVKRFISEFNSDVSDIIVGIGPHIMDCCFETKSDVYEKFEEKYSSDAIRRQKDKTYVNMQYCVLKQLKEINVLPQNITLANLCTYCEETLFYSHRRDKGNTGAMGSFVALN